ncbi:MAG: ferrous iron transporter B [Syntrophomonadaceae bacterium]|jgi:ferrous iron transport protein B|nr:ferrous iron transporter B [Syntrophomonadaceae bacterium]
MAIIFIGQPNTGKSVIFNFLTGAENIVSNYAGTSMEISKVVMDWEGTKVSVFDTPGVYSLQASDQAAEQVNKLLQEEKIDLIINVVDASRLEVNLGLTLELLEFSHPVVVALNQVDQAANLGIKIDSRALAGLLGCPVIETSIHSSQGQKELKAVINNYLTTGFTGIKRSALMSCTACGNTGSCSSCTMSDCIMERSQRARIIAEQVVDTANTKRYGWLEKLQTMIDAPFPGVVILLLVGYLGFVLLLKSIQLAEGPLTALLQPVNHYIAASIKSLLPPGLLSNILSLAVPEGLIVPFTIVMPAMLMVSIIMALLEDSGLLPRYSVAFARLGSLVGISGEAVIPLSLGFGCRTPAVVASRMITRERERFIVITILSIVIPCAATLGILTSVIAAFHVSPVIIVVTMLTTLIVLGLILNHLLPQEKLFVCELPPLRIPTWGNLLNKIKIRFAGFFTEVLPLLLVMSIAVRALIESGVLEHLYALEGISRSLFGIPAEALVAVLITIFQRYLAPLILLHMTLTPREATIAIAMISLSLPCLPAMVMIIREIGARGLLKILGMGFLTSFIVGISLNILLPV